jgi:Tryptophan-rich Synechocystis species C-terminal domain
MIYQDGQNSAPSSAPQLQTLLNGYAVRPPWKVAGVDYAVGPNSTPTKNPATISMAGVTVDTSTDTIAITGSNITLDGYNFAYGGHTWSINVFGNNDAITNSYFLLGPASTKSVFIGGNGSNLTLKYDTMDGKGAGPGESNPGSSLISGSFTGTTTLEYNLFENFQQHVFEYNGSGSLNYEYNVIYNGGGTGTGGAHLNYLQFGVSSTSPAVNATVEFNTTYEPNVPNSGGQGFQLYGGNINATLAYNTMIYSPNGDGVVQVNSNGRYPGKTTAQVHDNYINRQNGGGYFYSDTTVGTSDFYSGDINLVTGGNIDAPDTPLKTNNTTSGQSVANGAANTGATKQVEKTPPRVTAVNASGAGIINGSAATRLSEAGNHYYLYGTSRSGTALKYNGHVVNAGEFGKWIPISAVRTANGYDVAWKNGGSGQYTGWITDRNGNYKGNSIGSVSGNSYALESLEQVFRQDLNRDGTVGPTKKLIQKDGATQLTEVANNYYLYGAGGNGPALNYRGTQVTTSEFGSWTPISAVFTAHGYDVAWKNTANNTFTVWTTDAKGNYSGNLTGGAVMGTSSAFELAERTFNEDLNHDRVIGLYAVPRTTLQITKSLAGTTGSATIGKGATLNLTSSDSSSVTFASSTGTLLLEHSSTFKGEIFKFNGDGTLAGSDHIDLRDIKYGSIKDSYANGVLTVADTKGHTAKLLFSGSYSLGNFRFAGDGSGGTIVYDPPVSSYRH